jgi:hypothetical protein
MIKITAYVITAMVCFFGIAIGDVWDNEIKERYPMSDSKAHAEYLSKSLISSELNELFQSNNKGDFISFCFYSKKAVKNVLNIKTRDADLEKLFNKGLDDTRSGFVIDNDIIYSSPSAVCAFYLAEITKYNEWLKETSGEKYIEPLFSFNQNEITKLKNWYKNIYLPGVVSSRKNEEVIDFEAKEGNKHSELNKTEIQLPPKKVYNRNSNETSSSMMSGAMLILTVGGFVLLLVLFFLVNAARKRHYKFPDK